MADAQAMTIPEQAIEAAARALCRFGTSFSTIEATNSWVDEKWSRFKEEATIALTAAAPHMSGVKVNNDVVERVARAWASIDGKSSEFDRAKKDHEFDRTDGSYSGYMAETKELIKRSGLFDTEPSSAREQVLDEVFQILQQYSDHPSEVVSFVMTEIGDAVRALKSQPASDGWQPIKKEPDNTKGPFLVTNNPKALDAFGRPSHVWCVNGIYKDEDGGFCAYEGNLKIHGLTMFMQVPAPQIGGGE